MSSNSKYNKANFVRFVMSTVEHESSDKEKAKEALSAQGVNFDSMLVEGMKRFRRLKLKIEAEKTRTEMVLAETAKQRATEWVDGLFNKSNFSLLDLVREEGLVMSFKNVEKLGNDDIRNILVSHFTLKFMEDQYK